ncbi:MAG: hypothetical protein RL754_855 [Bacteroidota bacterium]|jgi:pimeloyl-ACP methyl ester carboxylesterase
MATLDYRGEHIHYTLWEATQDVGPGRLPLVLLHGFLEDSRMWDGMLEALRRNGPILTIDLPGHGMSANYGYEHTMEDMADAVYAVMDYCQLERAAILGHSMGGYVALAFAEHHPERMARMGLFFSTPQADAPERVEMRNRAAKVVMANKELFIKNSIPLLFDPEALDSHREAIDRQIGYSLEMSSQGIVAAIHGMRQRPDRTRLLFAPPADLEPGGVGVFAGIHDTVIPFSGVKEWWEAPAVGFRYESSHGHMGHLTDTEGCTEAIIQWWTR